MSKIPMHVFLMFLGGICACSACSEDEVDLRIHAQDVIPTGVTRDEHAQHFDALARRSESVSSERLADNIVSLSLQMDVRDLQWLMRLIDRLSINRAHPSYVHATQIVLARSSVLDDVGLQNTLHVHAAAVFSRYDLSIGGVALIEGALDFTLSSFQRLSYTRYLHRACANGKKFSDVTADELRLHYRFDCMDDYIANLSRDTGSIIYAIQIVHALMECGCIKPSYCCDLAAIVKNNIDAALQSESRDSHRDAAHRQLDELLDACCGTQ